MVATEEGRRDFQNYINKVGRIERFNKDDAALAMGPQKITLTGVPTDSHFARVMVAADYRMKRYAMHLEKSPVAEMPSFLDLLKERRGKVTNAMPRWWLACNYDGVVRSEDGLAWELQGPGVKVMTEDDFIAADGNAKGTGKSHPVAQEWADMFTSKYDELTVKDPVFGELRNIMDLCVVAALIEKYGMLNKAGLQIPLIKGEVTGLDHEGVWNEPKWVATQCSTMKVGRDWVITASGGVQIDSWSIAEKTITKPEVAEVHTKARASDTKQWWWN